LFFVLVIKRKNKWDKIFYISSLFLQFLKCIEKKSNKQKKQQQGGNQRAGAGPDRQRGGYARRGGFQ